MNDPSSDVWTRCWKEWSAKTDYQEDIAQHQAERRPLYRFLEEIPFQQPNRPVRVLEVACGTAFDSQAYHRVFPYV